MFIIALSSMLSLFFIMVVGYIAKRKQIFNDASIYAFNKFILYVTFPALIINSLNVDLSGEMLLQGSLAILVGFIYHGVALVIAFIFVKIFRIKAAIKPLWLFGITFANVSFLGFPLVESLFGAGSLFYASLFSTSFSILTFSLGVVLINLGDGTSISVKKVVLAPAFIAIIIGVTLFLTPISLPSFLADSIAMIANITAPLSMIVIGATLTKTNPMMILKTRSLYLFSFVRLIIVPVVVYFILNLIIKDDELLAIYTILAATPSAVLLTVIASQFKKDDVYAAELVFITTVLSVITLPIFTYILTR